MRSVGPAAVQEALPFDLHPTEERQPRAARPRGSRSRGSAPPRYRLRNDALASRGWPAGTELVVDEGRRPQRGEVALVTEGGRLKIGVFDVQFGRGVLRTDQGSVMLGSTARHVGVVAMASAPLDGMPPPA
jgi:hypothetical protein